MKRLLLIVTIIVLAVIVLGAIRKKQRERTPPMGRVSTGRTEPINTTVPDEFRGTYDELEGNLNTFDTYLNSKQDGQTDVQTTFGAELLSANGNRGEDLLKANSLQGNLLYLDKLEALGVGGVTIQMPYPILSDEFPRSAEYWAFYKQLVANIKKRGLKVLVKTGLVFTEKEISPLGLDYAGISLDEYFEKRKNIAIKIANDLGPDYLSIGNEPSTEMMILGNKGITEERYVRFVNDTLREIDRSHTLIGAGSGSWDKLSYVESMARDTTLDYIDIHIYPLASINADYLMQAAKMADVAGSFNKKIIVGEYWLYKSAARELTGTPTHVEMFRRDTFGFWAPLDKRMLEVISKFAGLYGIEYISPFWSKYFFAYLDYGPNKYKSSNTLLKEVDIKAVQNILANTFSETGAFYQNLIDRNR